MALEKQEVIRAFRNEQPRRVPVGFWYHFLGVEDYNRGVQDPGVLERSIEGHKRMREEADPDFVKIMTDGLFFLPYEFPEIRGAKDLAGIRSLGQDHPFFERNVELVSKVRKIYGPDILLLFHVFSPLYHLNNAFGTYGDIERLRELVEEDPRAVRETLDQMAEDLCRLIRLVSASGLADGIYFAVKNPGGIIEKELYQTAFQPGEEKILETANSFSTHNILHICGYSNFSNDMSLYRQYDAEVFNWATRVEHMSLSEGKQFFGKAVLGGLDNSKRGVLCSGTEREVRKAVADLLDETGRRGVILGADCTIPPDIEKKRLRWVREAADF